MLSRFVPVYSERDPQLETKDGGLIAINYFTNLSNTFNVKDYQVCKKNPFFNQSTSIFSYYGCRNINAKIFNNGMLQMTGIQSVYEAEYVSKCIISILKNARINVYLDSQNLPTTSTNFKYIPYYNPKTNNVTYYRWNYLEIMSEIEEKLKIDVYSENQQLKQLYDSYINKWTPEAVVTKFITNLSDIIEERCNLLKELLIEQSNETSPSKQTENSDIISSKNAIINNLRNIHNKLATVNNMDRNITTSIMNSYKDDLQDLMIDCNSHLPNDVEYDFFSDTSKLKLTSIKTELINSDFCANFIINNTKLHQIIKNKYKIFSSYEPNDYPGVKNKFCWNPNNNDNNTQGICKCLPNCVERGKKSICVQITISVFQSGSIIITGSKNTQQIKDAYNFIIKILNDNYDEIKGKGNNEAHNVKAQEKINNNRKIMRKKQLFFIKKENIMW